MSRGWRVAAAARAHAEAVAADAADAAGVVAGVGGDDGDADDADGSASLHRLDFARPTMSSYQND